MNEVKLQGQITSDPEVKESRNGILRGSFLLTTKGGTEDRPLHMLWKFIQNIWYVKTLTIHSRTCINDD